MAEERVTTVETPSGETHSHTTVIADDGGRGGSGAGWLIAIVLIIAIIAGIYFFSNMSASQSAKDNAIAGAAHSVGKAASQVGNAAQDATNNTAH